MSKDLTPAEREKLERKARARPQEVVITKIDIPFIWLVEFLVKVTIASIPAAIIVAIIIWGVILFLGGLVGK